MSLQHELDRLNKLKNPHERGSQFEGFISRILEEQGFDVTFNSKVAKPRQTDLFAQRDGIFCIVETKWQSKPIDVGDLDAVRARLGRTVGDVFACVFSMSPYAKKALIDLTNNRRHEILLFDKAEINGIVIGDLSLVELLQRKRDEFRKSALVWFEDWKPKPWSTSFSKGPETFLIRGQSRDYVVSVTQGDNVMFVRSPLDLGVSTPVSLRLQVHVHDLVGLQALLRTAKNQLGLAGTDSFAIHQGSAGWYGAGVDNFINACRSWQTRYGELNWESFHHSEQLGYFDELASGGLFIFTIQQQVRKNVRFHCGFIEILLPGIPIDISGIRRLCSKTGNQAAMFEYRERKATDVHRFHTPVILEPIGLIVDSEGWATGILAKNPFYKSGTRSSFEASSLSPHSSVRHLSNTERLACRLKSWHRASDLMDRYCLFEVEGCWIDNHPCLYVGCDWS